MGYQKVCTTKLPQRRERDERVTEDGADGEPPRMEIKLSVPGMDPEAGAAMRERIEDGLPRWDKVRPQAEPFVKKASSRPPDNQTGNQHFISQFWLRLFHPDEVAVLDVGADPDSKGFGPVLPVAEAAAGFRLFTLQGEDGSTHESRMHHIETKVAPIFKRMAAGESPADDFERFAVAFYLAFIFLQSPVSMRLSAEKAEADIEKLARETEDELGVDLGDLYDLDTLKQRYAFSALLDWISLVNKLAFLFFCRSWHLIQMPESWPLALPMFPIVNWGQGLQPAPDVSVVLAPNRLLIMSWPTLPDGVELTDGQCSEICEALIRHAEATDGKLITRPEHRDRWARDIKGHQEEVKN